MVELKNVSKTYGEKAVLKDCCLTLPKSGAVAVAGPSGCGKTTFLRLLAGLIRPDSGEVLLPQGAKIAMVFQEDRLLPGLSARGNVLAVLDDTPKSRELAEACLGAFGLTDVEGEKLSALSGGMKRRVAIARALTYGGDILLMDEPFKGLDAETKARVADFVFADKKRLTVFVTHLDEEIAYAETLLCFDGAGKIQVGAIK